MFGRTNTVAYTTGKLLGKGGFAICYASVSVGTRQQYALKIVKRMVTMSKITKEKVRFVNGLISLFQGSVTE
jgi:hypothetical protein